MELIMENIRCFAGEHRIPVKPLTFLVGENSTGKTTFLATLSMMLNPESLSYSLRLNDAPYSLGNYNTFATSINGKHASHLKAGYESEAGEFVVTYGDNQGQVDLKAFSLKVPSGEKLVITVGAKSGDTVIQLLDANGNSTVRKNIKEPFPFMISAIGIESFLMSMEFILQEEGQKGNFDAIFKKFMPLLRLSRRRDRISKSIAPIRSEPKRTYDEVVRDFSPKGDDVPFVMSSVINDAKKRTVLEQFGVESGLFGELQVNTLQGGLGEPPRQIAVTNVNQSSRFNLVDVGYGVSQVLPVLVQSLLSSERATLLLQQPEVHLHPRAQAALGTLFVNLVAANKNQFVIETHSDYILDRVRQEAAKGNISAKDVQFLYFERQGYEAKVYPIDLDEQGNILNAPPNYRDFFLREEMNLLSR